MTDYTWPEDITPYAVSFYLQPHTGGSESPFSRKTKVYGLSAPRWVCQITVKGGNSARFWGRQGVGMWAQRLEAFVTKLQGRLNRAVIYDHRRPRMSSKLWPSTASNDAVVAGATTMQITGLPVGTKVYAGDYVGGDGRPHMVLDDVIANGSGAALVTVQPPFVAAISSGNAIFGKVPGKFRLASDDAGQVGSQVGELTVFTLDFVEDL